MIWFISLNVLFCLQVKAPIFRRPIIVPDILHTVNLPINSLLQAIKKLVILACIGGFGARYPEDALSKETPSSFSNADWLYSWMLI